MDQRRYEQLIAKINQQGMPGSATSLPVVSLEDFFVGNDDLGSIGCNLLDSPGPQVFYQMLQAIRSRPNVQDVLVEITEVSEEDPAVWPFSDRVYVVAEATVAEVEDWVKPLEPDEVGEGYAFGIPPLAALLEPSMKVFRVWWD